MTDEREHGPAEALLFEQLRARAERARAEGREATANLHKTIAALCKTMQRSEALHFWRLNWSAKTTT